MSFLEVKKGRKKKKNPHKKKKKNGSERKGDPKYRNSI
jgi:hypothetical protein